MVGTVKYGKDQMKADFAQTLTNIDPGLQRLDRLRSLQVNLGNRCNQSCSHCHVGAGPTGDKVMSKAVMERIISFLKSHSGLCADITGGCPELNPNFEYFISNVHAYASRLMVRTNLTVILEPTLQWIAPWYAEHKVVLIGSLPCYTEGNVDKQRGTGAFNNSIAALRILNDLGYGVNGQLQLNLVYNPGGDFLPGPQEQLEADYKRELNENYGVSFNRLFTITNAPIGRFRRYLQANGRLQKYLTLLTENFNPRAAQNIMCRTLVSINYRGIVYNCDFNQAMELPLTNAGGRELSIEQLEQAVSGGIEIITGQHCFCCTAGAGSSCTGSLVKQT